MNKKEIQILLNKCPLIYLPIFRGEETLKDLSIGDIQKFKMPEVYLQARAGIVVTKDEINTNIDFLGSHLANMYKRCKGAPSVSSRTVSDVVDDLGVSNKPNYIKNLKVNEDSIIEVSLNYNKSKKCNTCSNKVKVLYR